MSTEWWKCSKSTVGTNMFNGSSSLELRFWMFSRNKEYFPWCVCLSFPLSSFIAKVFLNSTVTVVVYWPANFTLCSVTFWFKEDIGRLNFDDVTVYQNLSLIISGDGWRHRFQFFVHQITLFDSYHPVSATFEGRLNVTVVVLQNVVTKEIGRFQFRHVHTGTKCTRRTALFQITSGNDCLSPTVVCVVVQVFMRITGTEKIGGPLSGALLEFNESCLTCDSSCIVAYPLHWRD